MLSALAFSALGAVEQCTHQTADCSDVGVCVPMTDGMFGNTCQNAGTQGAKMNCDGTTIKIEYFSAADCSTDASATCDLTASMLTGSMPTDCHFPFPIDKCTVMIELNIGSITSTSALMYKGTCPAKEDEPCFSREAEACRVLDTSVAPSVAFRACFDEPAPTVAERGKMTALTGGD